MTSDQVIRATDKQPTAREEMSPAFRQVMGKALLRSGRRNSDPSKIKAGKEMLDSAKITAADGVKLAGQIGGDKPATKLDRTPTNDPNGTDHLTGMSRKR